MGIATITTYVVPRMQKINKEVATESRSEEEPFASETISMPKSWSTQLLAQDGIPVAARVPSVI